MPDTMSGARSPAVDTRLAATWFGGGLEAAVRDRLVALARVATLQAGEELLAEGEPAANLSIVVSGRIGLRLRVPERGPLTILTVEPGDIVGWSAIVPPHRATSTATALVPTELLVFDGLELRAALADEPALAAAVYPRVLRAVARRLAATRLQLLDLFGAPGVEPW